jgi:hypothetical protein
LSLEQLKETVTPFDSVELIQVLVNPKGDGSYFTIEFVKQNVLPFDEEVNKRSIASPNASSLDKCQGGKLFNFYNNDADVVCEFCDQI